MKWIVLWFTLAALMAAMLVYTHAGWDVLVPSFVAWCGGVVSALMIVKLKKEKEEKK